MKRFGTLLFLTLLATVSNAQQESKIEGPSPINPVENAVLDNGCSDGTDPVEWTFEWTEVQGAVRYHLWVIHSGARLPAVNQTSIKSTSYTRSDRGYIAPQNQDDWTWRVRALTRDGWTKWSDARHFSVELMGTDCPGPDPGGVGDKRP